MGDTRDYRKPQAAQGFRSRFESPQGAAEDPGRGEGLFLASFTKVPSKDSKYNPKITTLI